MKVGIDELHRQGKLVTPSYVIIHKVDEPQRKGFQCLLCLHRPSWNPNDVAQRYCANCGIFHYDLAQYLALTKWPAEKGRE